MDIAAQVTSHRAPPMLSSKKLAGHEAWASCCSPPSDTSKPHGSPFPGMPGRHPDAGFRQRRATGAFSFLLPVRAFQPGLACFSCDGLRGSGCACPQGPGCLVVGQGDLIRAEVPGRFLRAGRGPGIHSAAGPAPSACLGDLGAGQQETKGGQLRQGVVLPDVGVPRPIRVGRGGGGVPVAAPVRGPAVGPR
jgi:hypothetical protein